MRNLIEFLKLLKNVFIGNPLLTPSIKVYAGKIKHGTPYFLPRRWVKKKNKKGLYAKPTTWFNFQVVNLGYKIKWDEWDYRFEWSPMISIVFCKLQFCIWIVPKHYSYYWECWLVYRKVKRLNPQLSQLECIKIAREKLPQMWKDAKGNKTDYWELLLNTNIGSKFYL